MEYKKFYWEKGASFHETYTAQHKIRKMVLCCGKESSTIEYTVRKQKGEVSAMVATILIAAALVGYSIFVVVRKIQRRKNGCGGCCGCGKGNCQKSKKL